MLVLALVSLASAYETDQFTRRSEPLADAAPLASARVDEIIDQAVTEFARKSSCSLDDDSARRILAREIHHLTSRPKRVPGRGWIPGYGYTAYTSWLETGPFERRTLTLRDSIYAGVTFRQSPILHTVGICSTIRIGSVLVGTDKFFHFFDEGYGYFRESGWGRDDGRATAWGTRREATFTGLETSAVFSYADLMADWAGYTFYRNLFRVGSPVGRGENGCPVRVGHFDWTDWISDEMDEFVNPSVFIGPVRADLAGALSARRDEVCAALASLSTEQRTLRGMAWANYISPGAPARDDVWDLSPPCPVDPTPKAPALEAGEPALDEGARVPVVAEPPPPDAPPQPEDDDLRPSKSP